MGSHGYVMAIIGDHMMLGSFSDIKINIEEGVSFARDICHGMTYLHSLEPLITRFDLTPHHVFVSCGVCVCVCVCVHVC